MRLLTLTFCALVGVTDAAAAEQPVPAYVVSDANAGARPFADTHVYDAFHGREGLSRVVAEFLSLNVNDKRMKDIFAAIDRERLERTLTEQLCYLAGGPCHYSGRDMAAAHKDMGLQARDFAALVENLQTAMDHEHVAFSAQNQLLSKLAPMHRVMLER